MKFVIQHVLGERVELLGQLSRTLPDSTVIACHGDPMETFRRSLLFDSHWHIEDDAILAPDFLERATALTLSASCLIQGFSLGVRCGMQPGSSYSGTLCVYLPEGYGPNILKYSYRWPRLKKHPTGFDFVVRDWLVERKEKYWIESPSMVQHASVKSLLGPRSKFRQSPTFAACYGDLT